MRRDPTGVGHSARNAAEWQAEVDRQAALYHLIPVPERVWDHALQTQRLLATQSTHRGVGIGDLLIAATAHDANLTLVHYDHDFDLIAAVTGQPTWWVAERGSVP